MKAGAGKPNRGTYPGSLARKLSRCKEAMRTFCRPGTNFIEHYAYRGTSFIGAGKLSRYRILIEGIGAVSRKNVDRSQKTVKVQDFNCGHWCGVQV